MYDVDMNSGEDGKPSSPVSETERYELVYSWGIGRIAWHGGPYHGITEARTRAVSLLKGQSNKFAVIYIVPYSAPECNARYAVRLVRYPKICEETPSKRV